MRLVAIAALVVLVPLGAALPGSCADPCVVVSSGNGYNPIVVVLASGGSVVWESSDYTHITRDGRGFLDGSNPCFLVDHDTDRPSLPVRFDLVAGALVATSDGQSATCTGAVATPVGAVMPYFCTLHPTMRGAVVVLPSQ